MTIAGVTFERPRVSSGDRLYSPAREAGELLAEVRQAADLAVDEEGVVLARHLSEHAGAALATPEAPPPPEPAARPSDEAIAEALRAEDGNVARASRALGMHRTQLYRWMARRDRPADDS